ncbi:hypothetical protein [Shewanella indica]|uniref:hypothetical protein n=1 Tax=Shewanella indica TaxID=768528 RepID=UPI002044368A|nr:hypothetical protein [Shewanella indica]
MLSDSGDLSFTDVDINDSHSVGSSYNDDVLWSDGDLDQATPNNPPLDTALISALEAGFSVDNSGWNYEIANSLVQFLAVGETIRMHWPPASVSTTPAGTMRSPTAWCSSSLSVRPSP